MIDWNPNLIKKMRLKEGNKLIVFDQEKVHTSSPIGGVIFTDKISEAEGILFCEFGFLSPILSFKNT